MSSAPPLIGPGSSEAAGKAETRGYLSFGSESLHYVCHLPRREPKAMVLFAGPLPDERTHSHLTWVRWARLLAEQDLLVMRFDYSGTGESTGNFEKTSMTAWFEEIFFFASKLRADAPSIPLIICGLRLGAMLASRAFNHGLSDALLGWSAPDGGEAVLIDAARRQQAANIVQGISGGVPGPRAMISTLEGGGSVEINGYSWTPDFWSDARCWKLEAPSSNRKSAVLHLDPGRGTGPSQARKRLAGAIDRLERIPISWPPFWVVGSRLVHDTSALFERSCRFIEEALRAGASEKP